MIDIENELFTKIATVLRNKYSGIYVTGDYVAQPPKFPAVYISEMDNTVNRAGRDSGDMENYADVMYQVDVYSNRASGKRAQARDIMATVDAEFAALNFTRNFLNPVPNMNDATIYRLTGRWVATVGKDDFIYRR